MSTPDDWGRAAFRTWVKIALFNVGLRLALIAFFVLAANPAARQDVWQWLRALIA